MPRRFELTGAPGSARIVAVQRQRRLEQVAPDLGVQFYDGSPLCTLALARYLGHPVPPAASPSESTRSRRWWPGLSLPAAKVATCHGSRARDEPPAAPFGAG